MKKFIFVLLLLTSLLLVSSVQSLAHLALPHIEITQSEPTGLQFIIINYEGREDIDFLFQNSSRVLGYFEDMEGDPPFFLSLVNTTQRNEIEAKGYIVRLIDENTTLSDYMLLYNHSVDQSDKLKDHVEVYTLSSHYTLIRINSSEEFDPHEIPDAVEFGPVPFLEGISPPLPQEDATEQATPVVTEEKQSSNLLVYIAVIAFVIILVGAGIALYLIKRKQKPPVNPPILSQENNLPPPGQAV